MPSFNELVGPVLLGLVAGLNAAVLLHFGLRAIRSLIPRRHKRVGAPQTFTPAHR